MRLNHQRDTAKQKLSKPYNSKLYKPYSPMIKSTQYQPNQGTAQAQWLVQKLNKDHVCPTNLEAKVDKAHKQCAQANASIAQRIKRRANLLIIKREYKTLCRYTQIKCKRIKWTTKAAPPSWIIHHLLMKKLLVFLRSLCQWLLLKVRIYGSIVKAMKICKSWTQVGWPLTPCIQVLWF